MIFDFQDDIYQPVSWKLSSVFEIYNNVSYKWGPNEELHTHKRYAWLEMWFSNGDVTTVAVFDDDVKELKRDIRFAIESGTSCAHYAGKYMICTV